MTIAVLCVVIVQLYMSRPRLRRAQTPGDDGHDGEVLA